MANQMNFLNRSINADLWINRDENVPKNTPMREFYYGKTIFLTGGTGFLGQLFVEKLLRCVYNLFESFLSIYPFIS